MQCLGVPLTIPLDILKDLRVFPKLWDYVTLFFFYFSYTTIKVMWNLVFHIGIPPPNYVSRHHNVKHHLCTKPVAFDSNDYLSQACREIRNQGAVLV